jgi:DnaK suppressor protein
MNAKDRIKIKETLIAEKEKMELKVTDLLELTKPIPPEDSIGRISRMDAINNKSINEAALRTAQSKLKNINLALEKINDSDFGQCNLCGATIPIGRLLIMPGSSKCIGCASKM